MRNKKYVLVALAASALLLVGCSSAEVKDDEQITTPTTETAVPEVTPTPTEAIEDDSYLPDSMKPGEVDMLLASKSCEILSNGKITSADVDELIVINKKFADIDYGDDVEAQNYANTETENMVRWLDTDVRELVDNGGELDETVTTSLQSYCAMKE